MLKALDKLLGRRSSLIETAPSAKASALNHIEDAEIPRYPPFAKGLPVAPLNKIMATQAELIAKIRHSLGFTVEDFDRLVLPMIQRYAAFVHLLPASESHHHRGAGGLFRHGLEVAFWAAQGSESVIFSIEGTPRERRDNEPCWRLASCCSGLLHDVGKPLSDVSITDKDGVLTWNPYSESLHDWAHCHQIDRYFIRWRDKRHKRHEQFSLLAVDRILPAETREFLSKSGPSIIEAMLEAISGTSVNQPVTKLMLRADQESVARDLRQSRLNVDEFSYGVPVERYVFDAIRRLVKTGKWRVNEPGARVWHLNQGVFIAWKPLGDFYDLISHDKIPGIPRDPDTLADILIERGFALPNTVQEKGEHAYYRYWEVLPEMLQEASGSTRLLMLRLESNDLVFTNEPPAAVAAVVIGEVKETEISFVDPDDVDDDQVAQDVESVSATLGVGNEMEELESTSKAIQETSLLEDKASTESHPLDPGKKDRQQSASGKGQSKTDTEKQTQQPAANEALSLQDIARNALLLTPNDASPARQQASDELGERVIPGPPVNAPTETRGSDVANLDNADVPVSKKHAQSLKRDYVSQAQNVQQDREVSMLGVSDASSRRDMEPFTVPTDASAQTTPTSEIPRADKPRHPETEAKTLLLEMLAGYGEASALLEQAIMPVLEGHKPLGDVLCMMKGQAVILYPEGARSLGSPSEVLSTLSQTNAIVADPIMPSRKVRDVNGVKAMVLAEQLSDAVVAALQHVEESVDDDQDALELVVPSASDATKNKPVVKRRRRKKGQRQKQALDATNTTPTQKPKGKDSRQPLKRDQQTTTPAVTVEALSCQGREEKQNVARLPQRESRPAALAPQIACDEALSHVLMRENSAQAVREVDSPKAQTAPKNLNEDDFLPSDMTPQKALQMLKQMIQKRAGRWLVTPVLEEDGCLVTSDKAFDLIAGENMGISKHILCGMLSRAQRRPVLKKRQGKLYLKVDET